jgi:hypothetical protein
MRKAQLVDFRFHDLRHTMGAMASAGGHVD